MENIWLIKLIFQKGKYHKKRYLPFGYQMNEGNIMTEYEEKFSSKGCEDGCDRFEW